MDEPGVEQGERVDPAALIEQPDAGTRVAQPVADSPAAPPDAVAADAPQNDAPLVAPLAAAQIDGLAPGMTIVRHVRGPRRWPGILACVLAILMLAATGAGIQVASAGDYAVSTDLAYAAIGLSVAAILFGLIAIFGRWARGAGIVGVIVAVAGNPLVLLSVLGTLSGS